MYCCLVVICFSMCLVNMFWMYFSSLLLIFITQVSKMTKFGIEGKWATICSFLISTPMPHSRTQGSHHLSTVYTAVAACRFVCLLCTSKLFFYKATKVGRIMNNGRSTKARTSLGASPQTVHTLSFCYVQGSHHLM